MRLCEVKVGGACAGKRAHHVHAERVWREIEVGLRLGCRMLLVRQDRRTEGMLEAANEVVTHKNKSDSRWAQVLATTEMTDQWA